VKLCRLHLKNLNSLAGEWAVDFEDPAFGEGLFSITGPTGAGKSTLLDALSLALFGRTPRLDRVNNSGNEIMTRGASECFAEAVFEIGGKRYSAFWSQKRATRKNSSGALQAPKCRLFRLSPDEAVLADSVNSMAKSMEEICRLDFERFSQTVLLPQGGFAAFLQADGTERARMLEELTGAEIYRKISREVFERNKRERAKLEQIESSKAEHAPLSDEERAAALRRSEASESREKELRAEEERLRRALDWYALFEDWRERSALFEREQAALERDLKAFEPQSERLAQAERAAQVRDFYDAVRQRRERKSKLEASLKELQEAAAGEARMLEDAGAEARAASERLLAAKGEAEARRELLAHIRGMDLRIEELSQKKSLQSKELQALQRLSEDNQAAGQAAAQELDDLNAGRQRLSCEREAAAESRDRAIEALHRADLSALSAVLEEGQPCPLCGALHHPSPCGSLARGEDVLKLRSAAESADKKLKKLTEQLAASDLQATQCQLRQTEAATRLQSLRTQLDKLALELAGSGEELERLLKERQALFGGQDPRAAEKDMKRRLDAAEEALARAETKNNQALVAAAQRRTAQEAAETALADLEAESAGDEAGLTQRLQRRGFADEKQWLEALMPEEPMESLRARREELDGRAERLRRQKPILEEDRHKLGTAPEEPREDLELKRKECGAALTGLLKDRGADEQLLRQDDECRRRLADLEAQSGEQRKVCALWGRLSDQIGSAKGDLFSKYVQGLTFRRLVSAANAQLAGLSDRYRLTVSKEDALRLDVIDLWQAGEVRSSRNLSGGESFIVSLALALALSHGLREVKVDSLFLDEGFGTLDDETLDTVLDCLNRLHDTGKIIGVISHVKWMRERIGCQIEVVPSRRGHSELRGPGCSRLDRPC
jgi:exonuclease SbcC